MSPRELNCERSGAFEHRCRQGHAICISYRAVRGGILDPTVVAEACDSTDPYRNANREQKRRMVSTASDDEGRITRA